MISPLKENAILTTCPFENIVCTSRSQAFCAATREGPYGAKHWPRGLGKRCTCDSLCPSAAGVSPSKGACNLSPAENARPPPVEGGCDLPFPLDNGRSPSKGVLDRGSGHRWACDQEHSGYACRTTALDENVAQSKRRPGQGSLHCLRFQFWQMLAPYDMESVCS